MINNIKFRKLPYFGRIQRSDKYQLLCLQIRKKIFRKWNRERPKNRSSENLKNRLKFNAIELFNVDINEYRKLP